MEAVAHACTLLPLDFQTGCSQHTNVQVGSILEVARDYLIVVDVIKLQPLKHQFVQILHWLPQMLSIG